MFENKFPIFSSGRILSIEMLNALRDYPKMFVELLYSNYSDGIIEGLKIEYENKKLVISKGILKYKGEIYFLRDDFRLDLPKDSGNYVVKVIQSIYDDNSSDFTVKSCSIGIYNINELSKDDLEIGKFGYTGNDANIICEYNRFDDFSTPSNTLDIRCVKYSTEDSKGTISPVILKVFANELLTNNNLSSIDYTFAFQCLNDKVISRAVILKYIELKSNENIDNFENEDIYERLRKILSGKEKKIQKYHQNQVYEMEVL